METKLDVLTSHYTQTVRCLSKSLQFTIWVEYVGEIKPKTNTSPNSGYKRPRYRLVQTYNWLSRHLANSLSLKEQNKSSDIQQQPPSATANIAKHFLKRVRGDTKPKRSKIKILINASFDFNYMQHDHCISIHVRVFWYFCVTVVTHICSYIQYMLPLLLFRVYCRKEIVVNETICMYYKNFINLQIGRQCEW